MALMLYFLRHAQTAYCATGGYCGSAANDPGLTDAGHEMAGSFAQNYQKVPWTAIYSSPLQRALDTVTPLCQAVGMKPTLHDGLREIAYGHWEGLHPTEVDSQFHDEYVRWLTDPGWNAPTGGERAVDIARRASVVLDEIDRKFQDGNILLVSHKATIRIVLCVLMGVDVGRYRDRFAMPVGGLSRVELSDKGPMFHALADRSYLSPELQALPST